MKKTNKVKNSVSCSSCGASMSKNPELDFIKDSEGLTLCSECINYFNIAREQIEAQRTHVELEANESNSVLPDPHDLYDFLSKKVIGQDESKKSLAIAVSHHYRRLQDPSIGKSNVLIIGPTGTGKTELCRAIAEKLQVPFVSADATTFTTKGYVGEDVDSVVSRLLSSCSWNVDAAQQGIIFIDEIDKIARRGTGENNVGTVAVQQELLRLMEGDNVKVNIPSQNPGGEFVFVDTSKILFICAGAFVGLEEVVSKQQNKPIGFSTESDKKTDSWGDQVESKHLVQYGLIPELLGRLPVVTFTKKLDKQQLLSILKNVDNSIITQYQKLFKMDNVEVDFDESFFDNVAELSIKKDIGARGLRQIIEAKMKPLFFDISKYKDKKIKIYIDKVEII